MADVAVNSAFDPKELERERQVVFEEVRLGEDNPRSSLFRQLYTHVFPGHPYGRPVLGDEAALKAATRETLRGYYRRHYSPENMVLVVVGAVNSTDVSAVVERTFARVTAAGYRRRGLPPPPSLPGGRRRVVSRNEKQGHLALGWGAPAGSSGRLRRGPPRVHPRRLTELAAQPGAPRARPARLLHPRRLRGAPGRGARERLRPAGTRRPGQGGRGDPGRDPAHPDGRRYRSGAPAGHYRGRVRARLRHRDGRGIGIRLRSGGDGLAPGRGTALPGAPPERDPRADPRGRPPLSARRPLRRARLHPAGRRPMNRPVPGALGLIVAAGLTLIPSAAPASGHLPPVLRHRFPNGLTLLVRENPAAPVVAVSLQVKMGGRWERPEDAGISNLLQHVVVKGTARRSAQAEPAGRGDRERAPGDPEPDPQPRRPAVSPHVRYAVGLAVRSPSVRADGARPAPDGGAAGPGPP